MSTVGTAIFQPDSNFSPVTCGAPSSMSVMSVLVPPMSSAMTRSSPSWRATYAAPAAPPAGPDSMDLTACSELSETGAIPPLDWITNSGTSPPAPEMRSSSRSR